MGTLRAYFEGRLKSEPIIRVKKNSDTVAELTYREARELQAELRHCIGSAYHYLHKQREEAGE